MFGRTGNAKSSVTPASAWVTYLLLAIGIFTPVFCVVWLVQKTVESENALVRQLVEDARERSFLDAASLVRLTAMGMVPSSDNGGARYSWKYSAATVPKEEVKRGKAKLAEMRERISNLSRSEAQAVLATEISAQTRESIRLLGGRSLGLVLIDLGIGRNDDSVLLEDSFKRAAEAFLIEKMSEGAPSRQLRYSLRRYSRFSDSSEIARLVDAEALVDRWLEDNEQSGDRPLPDGLGSGDGYFCVVDNALEEVLVFPFDALLVECKKLESLSDSRFSFSLNDSGEDDVQQFKAPLDFLFLHGGGGSMSQADSSHKAVFYLWIGGIVLGLSVLSGVAIVVSVRRQQSVTRLKDNLVATVTHELKTPVASIRLLVDTLLNEERRDKVDTQEYIELISRENLRLGRLIDNFLSFSRMERSKGSFDIKRISPASVVSSAEEAFRERFKGQAFSLTIEGAEKLPDIAGDREALATVLGNLLENALKYGGRERRIELRCSAAISGFEFEVRDFGGGISKKDQKRVFRKFFQVDHNASGQTGSVGLGLSIVSFIVSKHSGQVELDSEIGKGSTFRVRIPYA